MAVECFITSIGDLFPKLFRKAGRHEMLVLFICCSFYLLHLLMVTEVNDIFPPACFHTYTVAKSY